MSFPLLSTLADLDSSLQAADAQLERLDAGLDVNEQLLSLTLIEACHRAASLTDLIHAELPGAQWNDRASLEALILELKAADDARRNQQRRSRLLELASELEAGHVQHRFEARSTQLNAMRSQAADELRTRAALPEQAEELPGPDAAAWLPWAFNLQDETDADALAYLRTNLAALERFTCEMDEGYWIAGGRLDRGSESASRPVAGAGPAGKVPASSVGAPSVNQRASADVVKPNAVAARPTGETSEVLASVYARSNAVVVSDEPRPTGIAPQSQAAAATATPEPAHPEKNNGSRAAVAVPEAAVAVHAVAALTTATPAEAVLPSPVEHQETAVAVAAIENEVASAEAGQLLENKEPTSLASYLDALRRRPLLAWGGVTGFVVLLSALFFFVIYHLNARPSSKPGPTVEAATTAAAANNPEPDTAGNTAAPGSPAPSAAPPASATATTQQGPTLHRQPAEGAQDSILLSLENCGRGKPDGIECWGYVSNLGGAASHISLDRVDIVDSHGNSFSVERNGQFAFPAGKSSSIPAGSRQRFTLTVPDKDAEARTLTLYMDLSNPRSLEYTFRDVPVTQ